MGRWVGAREKGTLRDRKGQDESVQRSGKDSRVSVQAYCVQKFKNPVQACDVLTVHFVEEQAIRLETNQYTSAEGLLMAATVAVCVRVLWFDTQGGVGGDE